jgi:hypothetical protein
MATKKKKKLWMRNEASNDEKERDRLVEASKG